MAHRQVATISWMIIVSGWLRTADAERAAYLGACVDVIAAARQADGCCDFYLAADPIESDRINVYERWATVEAVENFHGSGSDDQLGSMIVAGEVRREIIASTSLT